MLAYFLSVLVGTGSFGMYVAAFLFPEIYRKQDFIWSGLGLFYALVLWVEARQLNGGLLVGQTASVALLIWLGWQTITLRRQLATADFAAPITTNNSIGQSSMAVVESVVETTEPLLAVEPPQPWIEIRQEFPTGTSSIDPKEDPDSPR
jgi:Ycf66 protein N-terminus